ncbi:uncharacterized protein LOC105156347 [Sesamum indicum]|uniref:Uncharacterized protein LOC105156347 n=1 Tax=Sesamum indicum TaxID=4182 RepID=A0A6I9SLJ1_SESIN|nr:uncharacterized protein LOC105156347 [Sesamum indicum]
MEAPLLSTAPPIPITTPTPVPYPDSIDSSPRSRQTDSWEADAPPPQPPPKLRLMCSYGGHIVPRPHDKSLCYIGGDTRIIVIDRHMSLSDLHHRLSKNLLRNQPFSLKYQLPSEDLDSLISVATDEDLENMVEEYDRLHNAGGSMKTGRLRLFLFPKSSSSVEQLLVETASTKSEDWFFNALNGKGNNLSGAASDREFSETSSVNCLLGLDDDFVGKAPVGEKDAGAQMEGSKMGGNGNGNVNGNYVINHDVHSVPGSPMLETNSSFGSTSSSPSVANLPPIRVHVDEHPKIGGLGIEEQFQQMSVGVTGIVNLPPPQKQDEVGGLVASGVAVASGLPVMVGSEYANRSDDERSDHGGYRRAQQIQPQVQAQLQPQQIPQFQKKQTSAFDLTSPDSVSSDGSVTNPLSRQRQSQTIYQEPMTQVPSGNTRISSNQVELKTGDQNNSKIQMQPQFQESGYVLASQYDQNHSQLHQPQQFVRAGNQYIPAGAMPLSSYYPIYPPQKQHHHSHPTMLDQQHPVYFVSARQTQAYNLPVQQPSYSELAPTAPSSLPQTPPAAAGSPHAAYSQTRNAPSNNPDTAGGMYRTAAAQFVQVPSSHHQAQYVGFTQIHYPSQSMTPSSGANSTYAYEFADPTHAQMYYTQLPPQLAAQYQTLSSTPAMVVPDASTQLPVENLKQQVRTSQA